MGSADLGDAVPQAPWDLSLFRLPRRGVARRAARRRPPRRSQGSRSALGSHPCVALSSAGAKSVFPVSVSLGVYRVGNGQRQSKLVTSGVPNDFALGGQFGQSRADGGGANGAEFLQLLNGDGFLELGRSLSHAFDGRGWSVRLKRRPFYNRQGHGRA